MDIFPSSGGGERDLGSGGDDMRWFMDRCAIDMEGEVE
jgi:hypothetical protein